jgi:hypothetical protein
VESNDEDAMKPEDFDQVLDGPQFRRENPEAIDAAAESLGASLPTFLVDFYKRFRGPIGSDVVGYQLLDLIEDNPTVASLTVECRERFGFPFEWVVISDLNAGALLVLDCKSKRVYDVDFEGGVERLKEGEIEPSWESIEDFLAEFFQVQA